MAVRSAVAVGGSDTMRRILAAAAEEFARRGFASARVRQIVDAARVNLASVNYYFGGKEGLYGATLRHLASGRRRAPPQRRGRSPQQRLHREVYAILARYIGTRQPSPLSRIFAHEVMNPTAHLEQLIEDLMRPTLERLRGIVRELAGDEVSDSNVAHAVMSVTGQCIFYLTSRGAVEHLHPELTRGPDACKRLARHITDFSLAGIARLQARGGESE
jgi:AcrR family transcriptional regulator